MIGAWIRFVLSVVCLLIGLFFMLVAVFGVNRFHKALNRMHAAALGDTLGILFVILGLILMRGFSMDSLKLFLVVLFYLVNYYVDHLNMLNQPYLYFLPHLLLLSHSK